MHSYFNDHWAHDAILICTTCLRKQMSLGVFLTSPEPESVRKRCCVRSRVQMRLWEECDSWVSSALTAQISPPHFSSWHPATRIPKMLISAEIFGPWICAFANGSWHGVAYCRAWPRASALLAPALPNAGRQRALTAVWGRFVTNENFSGKFFRWRRIDLCVLQLQQERWENNSCGLGEFSPGFGVMALAGSRL